MERNYFAVINKTAKFLIGNKRNKYKNYLLLQREIIEKLEIDSVDIIKCKIFIKIIFRYYISVNGEET